MMAFTTSGRGPACPTALLDTLIVIALTVPLLIVTLALCPVLLAGPFLSAAHRRFVLRLLDSLRHWSQDTRCQQHRGDAQA